MIRVSESRRKRQGGQEIWEFACVALLFVPILMGSFVTGMGLVRSIQVNQVARDLANIYIHGGDFSTYPMQQLASRLAQGLNLQVGNTFAGHNRANTGNDGDGVVTVSKIMYIGGTTSPSCVSVGAANCTNANKFVFLERIKFGNVSVETTTSNSLGDPTTSDISTAGIITKHVEDAGAQLPSSGQSAMVAQWQISTGGRAPLVDQQIADVMEVWVKSPDLALGSVSGGGQYARFFF